MRNILFLVFFGIAWQNSFANLVPYHDSEEENVLINPLDSKAAKNALTLRIESLEAKFANLIKKLGYVESELTREKIQVEDEVPSELNEYNSNSQESFKKIGGKYYFIENDEKLTWVGALVRCELMDFHLVDIQNEEEWSAIRKHLDPHKNYWVDLSVDREIFVSKSSPNEIPFLKWHTSEPINLNCVKLGSIYDHYMNVVNCSEKNNFICKAGVASYL